jgi:hypothetical protein
MAVTIDEYGTPDAASSMSLHAAFERFKKEVIVRTDELQNP